MLVPYIDCSSKNILVIMTNPVDILTYHALKISNLPKNKVLGQGGILDTARYKYFLGIHLGINPVKINGIVINIAKI